MKRLPALAGLLAATALSGTLVACSSSSTSDSSSASGDAIINAYACEPRRPLLPADSNDACGNRIMQQIYSGLVYIDGQGNPHNDLAQSIDLQGDRTYKVTLKPDLKFSDGTPVTSHSFVDAWNWAVTNDQVAADFFNVIKGYQEGAQSMEGLKIIDDQTFTIELAEPEADFILRLAYHSYFPLPQAAIDNREEFGKQPYGTGTYQITNWVHNESLSLKPNPNYVGDQKAKNGGIDFKIYAQLDAAYADLLADNLDVLDQLPSSAYATFKNELSGRAVNGPAGISQFIGVRTTTPHFGMDEEGRLRRQAISMAIDRNEVSNAIFAGLREPATDFTAPVTNGYQADLPGSEVLQYNPEKAKELWAQADAISPFTGQLTISYNSDADHKVWVDALANQLRNNLGIDAVGNPYPSFKDMIADVRNSSTIFYRTGWTGDYPSQGNFLSPMFASDGTGNDALYNNPDFDAALDKANQAKSVDEAAAGYRAAQEILFRDLPLIPTWYGAITGGYSTKVQNVEFAWNSLPLYYAITKS